MLSEIELATLRNFRLAYHPDKEYWIRDRSDAHYPIYKSLAEKGALKLFYRGKKPVYKLED